MDEAELLRGSEQKFFSIVIPTRDRLDLLKGAIQSILSQDFLNFEVVIADNSSNDEVEKWMRCNSDPRVRYFPWGGNLDVTQNWNRAIELAEGKYILMLGDDDALVPKSLAYLHESLVAKGEVDCAYLGCFLFALPNAFPGEDLGFLRSYEMRSIYQGKSSPFFLDPLEKSSLIEACFNFVVAFDYNPQFWLINRQFLRKNFLDSNYYQGPYPDYFAAIATMILASTVLVVPKEIVVIGITKVSHGHFHFTGNDEQVLKFQNFREKDPLFKSLRHQLIPVALMPTLWAVTLEYLSRAFGNSINWTRYRKLQMFELKALIYERKKIPLEIFSHLKLSEKLSIYWLIFRVSINKNSDYRAEAFSLRSLIDTHPIFPMANIPANSELYFSISSLFGL